MTLLGRFGGSDERRRLQDAGQQALREERWEDAERLFRQAIAHVRADGALLDPCDQARVEAFESRLLRALTRQGKTTEVNALLESMLARGGQPPGWLVQEWADEYLEEGNWLS